MLRSLFETLAQILQPGLLLLVPLFLFYFLVAIVANLIDAAATAEVVGAITGLALLLPTLSVTVRRLHDTNRTGWWVLAPAVPAIIGGLLMVSGSFSIGGIFVGLAVLVDLVVLAFLIMPETQGDNRFGPDPKA